MNQFDIIDRLRKYPATGRGVLGDIEKAASAALETAAKAAKLALEEMANAAGELGPNLALLRKSTSDLTNEANNLSQALEYNVQRQKEANATFLAGVKSTTYLLERERELTKVLGMTAKASALLSKKYSDMSTNIGISLELTTKYRLSLEKLLPGMSANIARTGKWGDSLFNTTDLLRQHIDLTGEQTNALTLAAAATGTDLESSVKSTYQFAKAYGDATGEADSFKNIMSDVANTSLELRMEYSKYPRGLEMATVKARKLGLTMADIDKAATGLLDIEASVGKELEYQLISGKRLVDASGNSLTNKLREAKLSGNAEAQAEAMTEILTTQSDILDGNNFLAKQALADASGLTVAQLQGANANLKLQKQVFEQMTAQEKLDFKAKNGGREIKTAMDLTSDDLKDAIDKMPKGKDKDASIEALKATTSLLTPAEQQVDLLKIIVDKGVKLVTSGTTKDRAGKEMSLETILKESTDNIEKSRLAMEGGTAKFQKPDSEIGRTQTIAQMDQLQAQNIAEWGATLPTILNKIVSTGATGLATISKGLYGTKTANSVDAAGTDTKEDAFMMHDGVINFDKRDKFTMIASPYGALHADVADKITGAGKPGSGLDSNTIAKAIQSAIRDGLSNVSWTVNLDPMAVDKAIKFNSGRLNS